MTALASDNFNRADSASLGANWTGVYSGQNSWKIVSNTAQPTVFSGGADSFNCYDGGVTWPDDQYSKAVLTITGTNGARQGIGLEVRANPSAGTFTLYRLIVDHAASNNICIMKFITSTVTTLSQVTSSWSDGDTWELDVQSTTLTALKNGVSVTSATDSAISSGDPGLSWSTDATSGNADNWEGGNFAGGIPNKVVTILQAANRASNY